MPQATENLPRLSVPFPAVGFCPPVYGIRRTEVPFCPEELDGRLDKPFWNNAPWTDLFQDIEGPSRPSPRFRTRAKMLWDDQALYIGAELEGDEIWANVTERDAVIFYDNDFEVFIDPGSETQPYCEFEMNALNTIWDLFLTKPYRDGGKPLDSWDIKGLKTAVHIEGKLNDPSAANRKWSCEIVFPFRSILEATRAQTIPEPGSFWRMNFSRVQWTVDVKDGRYVKRTGPDGAPLPEDNWVWAPTGVVNIHYPELWGYAFFLGEEASRADTPLPAIPETERLKWQLRQVYYAQRAWMDRHGCFCADLSRLLEESSLLLEITPHMEVTTHSFEASCVSGRGETVLIFTDGHTVVHPAP